MAKLNISKSECSCQVEGCKRDVIARGLCRLHYNQARSKSLEDQRCKIDGCDRASKVKGMCDKHYAFMSRHNEIKRTIYDPNIFEIFGDICLVWLFNNNGKCVSKAIIDKDDYCKIKNIKWRLRKGYAVSGINSISMHHLIIGKPKHGFEIDHKDRNKLNNRRDNLRFATITKNRANTKLRSHNKTGFKGVSFIEKINKFSAIIVKNKKAHRLGYYDNANDAAAAYDKKAIELFGDFAATNADLGLL